MDTNNVMTHQQGSKGFRYSDEFKADVLSFLASGNSLKKTIAQVIAQRDAYLGCLRRIKQEIEKIEA